MAILAPGSSSVAPISSDDPSFAPLYDWLADPENYPDEPPTLPDLAYLDLDDSDQPWVLEHLGRGLASQQEFCPTDLDVWTVRAFDHGLALFYGILAPAETPSLSDDRTDFVGLASEGGAEW